MTLSLADWFQRWITFVDVFETLTKDYEDAQSTRPGICIKKANGVSFDFALIFKTFAVFV